MLLLCKRQALFRTRAPSEPRSSDRTRPANERLPTAADATTPELSRQALQEHQLDRLRLAANGELAEVQACGNPLRIPRHPENARTHLPDAKSCNLFPEKISHIQVNGNRPGRKNRFAIVVSARLSIRISVSWFPRVRGRSFSQIQYFRAGKKNRPCAVHVIQRSGAAVIVGNIVTHDRPRADPFDLPV